MNDNDATANWSALHGWCAAKLRSTSLHSSWTAPSHEENAWTCCTNAAAAFSWNPDRAARWRAWCRDFADIDARSVDDFRTLDGVISWLSKHAQQT